MTIYESCFDSFMSTHGSENNQFKYSINMEVDSNSDLQKRRYLDIDDLDLQDNSDLMQLNSWWMLLSESEPIVGQKRIREKVPEIHQRHRPIPKFDTERTVG